MMVNLDDPFDMIIAYKKLEVKLKTKSLSMNEMIENLNSQKELLHTLQYTFYEQFKIDFLLSHPEHKFFKSNYNKEPWVNMGGWFDYQEYKKRLVNYVDKITSRNKRHWLNVVYDHNFTTIYSECCAGLKNQVRIIRKMKIDSGKILE